MKRVFVVGGGNRDYQTLMEQLGFVQTSAPDFADLALFTGGEDVSPSLYGAKAHPTTHFNEARDAREQMYFEQFKHFGTPMLGICRGGQFLNVMSGGAMYQHVTNHTHDHVIMDVLSQNTLWASSTHHQMMKPSEKGLIVATAHEHSRRHWYEGESYHQDTAHTDIEVVYYEDTNCLCFQPHPEFQGERYDHMRSYLKELLNRFDMV